MMKIKRILSAFLACMLVMSIVPTMAFAAESDEQETIIVSSDEVGVTRAGLSGYNYKDGSDGTFTVHVSGEDKSKGYITIRIQNASDQNGSVYFQITYPTGSTSGIWATTPENGEEQKLTFNNAKAGNYVVSFWTEDPVQSIRFNCWIYG